MRSYEEYQRELAEEVQKKILQSEELDDVAGQSKPEPMTTDSLVPQLKGNHFRFSLESSHFSGYLIDARVIAEKILKRTTVNIELGL
jgi:hypothetical protein